MTAASVSRGVVCSARDRPRSGGEVVGRPPLGIELGGAAARPDWATAAFSLGAVRRCPELGLGFMAGLDERLPPESGGGAVGRIFFGIKDGNTGDADPLLRIRMTENEWPARRICGLFFAGQSDLRAIISVTTFGGDIQRPMLEWNN